MEASQNALSRMGGAISGFFAAIARFFSEFGTALAKGDLFVKLSVILWGAGYLRRKQYVKAILMTLLESSGVSGEGAIGNSIVDQAIGYIQTPLADPLTVETIASSVGYSPSYFSHVFQRETGLSPYRFVVKSRMDSAMQLLKTTRLSIQDIAFQVGFNSVANFCYAFRREKGLSPNECRKRPV